MTTAWDQFEELIKAEMRKVYSETAVDHSMNPRNLRSMEDSDGYAKITGPCGDTMQIWLKVDNVTIAESTFLTDGCGTTMAAGSMTTELAKGKTINAAYRISQKDILDALGSLPPETQHCALLAANTLKAALKNYLDMKNQPWKKAYRRE